MLKEFVYLFLSPFTMFLIDGQSWDSFLKMAVFYLDSVDVTYFQVIQCPIKRMILLRTIATHEQSARRDA